MMGDCIPVDRQTDTCNWKHDLSTTTYQIKSETSVLDLADIWQNYLSRNADKMVTGPHFQISSVIALYHAVLTTELRVDLSETEDRDFFLVSEDWQTAQK